MNKVFRVIWSQATQSWVAVSELTKAHKKQSSSNAQKSAVKFSGNFIKSSAIALTLLSGSAAYAADAASGLIQINSTGTATASGSESIAVGKDSKATSDTAVAIGKDAEASGKQSVALGNKAKATGENSYAIGWGSNASHPRSISIGYNSAARHNNSLALGYNTIASGPSSVALGAGSNALGDDSYAIGYGSKTNTGANFAMAFGNSSKANKANDIAFGKEAETRDQGQGHSIAIGYGAMSGTNNAGKNLNGNDAGGVAIGTGAYTGVNQTDGRSVNSSVAVGAGAGAGFRKLDNNGMPVQNATDVDNNDEVLKKAFGVKNVADYQKIAGGTNGYTNVNINEGTALGRNARAIGDQSVAIGAQTIAGMGAVALGGNDITQFANNKYYKSTKENFAATETEDHNQDAEISKDTISGAYNRLVGTKLDTKYKATYAQDGSVVLGAQAHSGTPLGTALGTNALVRKGAFGATAIGAGSQVQANAEAAVAIGMGSFADGKYAVAAGTAANAKESAVAAGYKAKADKSAVAVGDSSEATTSSVAVGQLAKAEKVADIAVGQGAVASGEQGAIAMGLGTNARGDSSIMIGGADVESASKQSTTFEKAIGVNEKGGVIAKDVVEKINGKEVTRHYTFAATKTTTGTVAAAFQELTGHAMDVSSLDFSKAENKNGHASTSLGVHSLAKGDLATAIGTSARADVIGSLALGTGAHATLQNAVAIGTGSTTELLGTRQLSVNYDSDGNIVSDDSKDIAYTFKWAGGTNTSEGDVVSFGSSGAERQLKNVAAGRVAEDSTDAINGSQLNSIAKQVASGWNIAGNDKTKVSGIGSDDQVNFVNGNGTTVTVEKQNEVKSGDTVTTAKGANVKFDVKAADNSLEVGANGVKVKASDGIETTTDGIKVNTGKGLKIDTADGNKVAVDTDGTTITVGNDGKVKAVTGSTEAVTDANKGAGEKAGQVRPVEADKGKLATVDAVANAVNNAAWSITSGTDGGSFATSGHTKTTEKISAGGSVTFKAGDNLIIKQAGTDFTYSLNPILSGLTSAEFKGTGANAPITKLTNAGITVTTPADAAANTPEKTVTLNQDGLNNGGNAIANVAGNLDGAKTGTTAPTTEADKPTTLNNSNAATVGDVLNAGWNLQGNNTAKDFVTAYDTVNFVDGDGTSVSVENTDNKTSKIKYSVNLGDGLGKDAATNKIKVKAADKSLEVTNDGVKVKAADNTLTTDANGLKVNTGNITASSVPTVADADKGKIATVGNVADAIKAAAWKATAAKTNDGENGGTIKEQEIKAGDTVTFEADKNIKIAQADGKFTFSTKDNVEFKSVKVGEEKDGKKPVNLTTDKATDVSNNDPANKPTTALNVSSDGKPTQITGVGSVLNTNAVPTIPAGTATDAAQQPKLVNLGTAHNQTALADNVLNSAATVRDLANMGWKVSADETTGAKGAYLDVVKNADEVKFVGKNAAKVSGKTENGVRTITVDVKVPDVKTAKLVSSTDGSVIAPSTDSKLQDALKAAKDELAALPNTATKAAKEAAEKKVKDAETALNKALDDKGVATAKNVADMINNSGFTLKTSAAAEGKKDDASTGDEVINPGKAVEMIAGKNLTVKQEADGKVTYSLNPVLTGLTSAEFKGTAANAPTTTLNNSGITITKPADTAANTPEKTVTLNQDGLNNGGNAITNVAGNLDGAKANTQVPTTNAAAPNTTNKDGDKYINPNNAATVGDVLNAGWNLQGNGVAKDFVKAYDTVDFVDGDGTTASVESKDGQTSTVKYSVNTTTIKADTANVGKVKAEGTGNTFATAETVASAINDAYWKAAASGNGATTDVADNVKAGDTVTFKAGKNLTVTHDNANKSFEFATTDTPEFSSVQFGNNGPKITGVGDNLKVTKADGTSPIKITNVANGSDDNDAVNVSQLKASGWKVAGNNKTEVDTINPSDQVNFLDGSGTTVTVEKDKGADGKENGNVNVKYDVNVGNGLQKDTASNTISVKPADSTITVGTDGVKVNTGDIATESTGKATTALDKAIAEATKELDEATKAGDAIAQQAAQTKLDAANKAKADAGKQIATVENVTEAINKAGWNAIAAKTENGEVSGAATQLVKPGETVTFEADKNVKITQSGAKFTFATKDAVEFKSVDLKDGSNEVKLTPTANGLHIAKSDGKAGTISNVASNLPETSNANKTQAAPTTVANSNAATVGDVLNAGWNLQGNGSAVDFVKPYDTVNFVNGLNTTAVVSTVDGVVSNVTYNVTGLPITYTDKDGKPVSKVGDKFYTVNEKGQPITADGKPAVKTNAEGKPVTEDGTVIEPIDTAANPLKTSLVNPSPEAGKTGTTSPTTLDNVTSKLTNYNDASVNGKTPVRNNLVDLSKPENGQPKVSDNTVATVGDLRNMGWIVSSDKKTDDLTKEYSDTVKNANEVKFVGEGAAIVSGKTDGNVRTITVKVDDQVSTNNAVTPVVYTDKSGNTVYPIKDEQGNVTYHTTPDGKGQGDKEIPKGDVITSVNGPEGTTSPTTLKNVKNNIPNVNDGSKTITNPDGTEAPNAGDVANINKAPLTAEQAAELANPKTKEGQPNPKYIGNNAATVSDVLNAGWNLQNNGEARDFVKPYDTVNFVNGANTTAVVTTNAEGTASDVTYNVTGLPIATTIATPNGPVQLTKVGDNYYPVKADGTPNIEKDGDGNPTNGYVKADDGKYYPASDVTFTKNPDTNVTTVTPKEGKKPVTFGNSLTNPNVVNTTDAPNNAVTAPTTLNNVKNNIPAVNDADKKVTNADGTDKPNAGDVANINKAPLTAKEAADLLKPMKDGKANPNFVGNNAATVSDVLNAGWNLQNNGAAKDFVKPYDTVNFRDGGNTTVTVTTDDNLTSHVQVNVTGLPVSNTITDPATGKQVPVVKVGDAFYRTNPDGTPNIERNDEGEPTNGYVRANDGKLYPRDAVEVTPNAADPTQPPTITPKADAKPTTVNTNLVNPNVDNTTDNPGNNVNTPNQLGNVANGAKTFNAVDADGKDYVKANNGKYYEPSKVNADGSLKDGTDATADAKNPLVLANDGKWYPADKVSDKGTPEAGATAVENPLAPKNAAGQPLVRAKDGKWYTPADVQPNGLPTPTAQPQDNAINNKAGLVDFANSNPNNAATIGDLQNMGWVVSAPGNSYSDQVRNANEVQFVGEGTAIVTGKTDDKGVRTITVKVDNQVSTNNSVTPVVYTDKNGNTVYPIKDDKGNVAYHTTPDGKGKGDTVVPNGDVNTSVNGPKDEQGNTRPASLGNVKNNIPAVNDVDKKVTNPDGTEKGTAGDVNNINKAPLTATEAADLLNPRKDGKPNPNFVGNNAATVSDVLNAGWNLQNNGTAKDFVKPYDTVNFINGLGTTAVVTTREGNTTSDVTFNVKAANGSVTVDEDGVKVTTGEMKPAVDANNKETGAIATSANPATAKQLKDALDAAVKELATAKDALKTAEKALEANPKDPALQQAVADKKAEVAAKQTPVDAAQKAHDEAGLNKVATVQNVAEAINNAGFNLTTSAATGGEKLKGAKNDGELIKPSNTVEMVAGKNLTVKQDDKGKITYATKDDVTFTNVNTGTLNVGSPNTYTDGKGNTYTKVGDNYYNPADVENGAPKPDATPVTIPADVVVKPVSPVTMKTEAAKLVMNNATDAQPSSALNITSKDGKPTQITGVGSTLNTNVVKTSPEGTPTTPGAAPKTEDAHLVDLKGTDADPVNKNAAATVGDLQNMGWVVSTKDGNGYTDVVKNANKVDFKGGAGISVKGETTKDGVREITISVKDGEVVKPNQFTAKVNGTDTPVTKVGDQYYNTADIDPKTGNPKDNVTPVTPDKGTTPTNAGDGYVTGNKVAAAIQKSGFIVGKQTEKLSAADFNDKDEKVNPDDELRFADGNNTKVKLATKKSVDKDGNKVTTTTVKVDVTGLPVQYTDKNGTRVTKVGNQYFTVDDKGNPTATKVKPENLTTNMVNPAAAPNVIGAPTTLGNVEGNLDGAKTGTTAPTDSHAAPNTADATKPNYVNTHNAATVGDVLNAGWNLQNNGKAKDFVKPYDTVNFVDGKGTKAVVETAGNLTSTVKFDVDAGKITADTTKPGAVKGPADETLTKALKDAKDALAKLPKDADAATVKAAQDKVDAAQKAIDDSPNSNKVATAQNVADMINNSGFTLKADKTKGDNSTAADLANGEMIHPGDTITMKAGKNMSVKHEKNGSITYETKDDVNFNSLSLGDSKHAPTLSADEDGSLRLGSKNNQAPVRISNVAPGIKDGDAVNVSQLKGVTKDLEDKIDGVAAGSNAAASLPQVYLPGKSMVAASVGTYGSQGALAVGYSSISDNGKWLIKGQINVNTKAKTGGGVGVGYLW
ncbi:YadA-like family protein [Neisseria sp.]